MDRGYFATYANAYDRIQPAHIEMYRVYHDLALDFIPFDTGTEFRTLDLGCGTGNLLAAVMNRWPRASALACDYSGEMIEIAERKLVTLSERADFRQVDLSDGIPSGIGTFDIVFAFSVVHHLEDEKKRMLFAQIHECLNPGGWFFFMDAMTVMFDDDVFAIGKGRDAKRRQERFQLAGITEAEVEELESVKARLSESAPDRDRLAPLAAQLGWLGDTGFRSVDYIWHFWMEHFIIARK